MDGCVWNLVFMKAYFVFGIWEGEFGIYEGEFGICEGEFGVWEGVHVWYLFIQFWSKTRLKESGGPGGPWENATFGFQTAFHWATFIYFIQCWGMRFGLPTQVVIWVENLVFSVTKRRVLIGRVIQILAMPKVINYFFCKVIHDKKVKPGSEIEINQRRRKKFPGGKLFGFEKFFHCGGKQASGGRGL